MFVNVMGVSVLFKIVEMVGISVGVSNTGGGIVPTAEGVGEGVSFAFNQFTSGEKLINPTMIVPIKPIMATAIAVSFFSVVVLEE